jgi:hypothetical protein
MEQHRMPSTGRQTPSSKEFLLIKTELSGFYGSLFIAVVCGYFGIFTFVGAVRDGSIIPGGGALIFCGISLAAFALAWSGWKEPR